MVFLANASNFVGYFLLSMHYPDATAANMAFSVSSSHSDVIAADVGGINASLPAHGADQLDHSNQRLISSYFNWFFFSLCLGGLLSCTMIWVEENKGWNWNFTITIIALSLAPSIFIGGSLFYRHKCPYGSALTRIFKFRTRRPHQKKVIENQYAVSAINSDGVDAQNREVPPLFALLLELELAEKCYQACG
ncbi:hypothetical protein ACFX2J_035232 [Malus domestica]